MPFSSDMILSKSRKVRVIFQGFEKCVYPDKWQPTKLTNERWMIIGRNYFISDAAWSSDSSSIAATRCRTKASWDSSITSLMLSPMVWQLERSENST